MLIASLLRHPNIHWMDANPPKVSPVKRVCAWNKDSISSNLMISVITITVTTTPANKSRAQKAVD